ncbi:inositol-pentakisphosphate 2-kinase-like isoform X1 [Salvia splendens]|uniref:inositol-pentakisphosphate 2-kinase-like isoform X1 n=1 Tax=Salvia splendens TaxID=180675 RepID=UPI001C2694B6|nr:inositol-pentakisphosphate 2-kinase-like isoform X1 [Salvia splendens]XP_042058528.1 inositol-pentakisphosphate 2-kinase-like isoform X1 [Salvia splendens]
MKWMGAILQDKDAEEWTYRGEGALNLVLAYCGSSPHFVGKVLRIQKVRNDRPECENGHSALVNHESLLWGKFEGIVSAPTREVAEHIYVQKVMCPLLGSEHVDAGIHVLVSREFLEAVDNKVLCQRPSWRVDAARINPLHDSVLLISDHSVFPHFSDSLREDFCVSVEIKPKGGFLPTSEFIAEGNAVKKRITQFKMHQALKLHRGKISQISQYHPLDLFSGSKDGIQKAIEALFLTPQNNFRVFLNGSIIFGGMGGTADSTSSTAAQSFHDGLKHVISAKDGMHIKGFVDLLTETIFKSGLLNRLLEVQKLDAIDIEGAIHSYYDIISQPCVVCRQIGGEKFAARYSSIHSMLRDDKVRIVRDYLISATAKDLSMMISFKSKINMDEESLHRAVFLESSKQTFYYKASFIDLDMKPLKKMEYYYELDQQIVNYYVQMLKDTDVLDCGETTQESLNTSTGINNGEMAN